MLLSHKYLRDARVSYDSFDSKSSFMNHFISDNRAVIQECDIQSYNQPGRYQVELLRERLFNATSQPRVERNSIESDDKNKGNQHKG